MKLQTIPRLLRTLWYTKPQQLQGKLLYMARLRPRKVSLAGPPAGLRFEKPVQPWLGAPPHCGWDGRHLRLISQEQAFGPGTGFKWDAGPAGLLFGFHVHQFDWARGPDGPPAQRLEALEDWVARHTSGIGWHPAPASLRTFAWIKLLTTPGLLPPDADTTRIRKALADSVATVAANPETHLLANHYLWNLLAVVFGGLCLEHPEADAWLSWQARLSAELDEQVLPDGGHYERCPTYHGLILENLLDLLNAARAVPGRLDAGLESQLEELAGRMLAAHRVWLHPDGEIALFGDSAFGIAQHPARLFDLAAGLGVIESGPGSTGALVDSGFFRLEAGPFVLIASAGRPAPDYQPGHSHCDALSFELSIHGQRVVTDTGVYEYVPGSRRDISRATRSHATIEIEDGEQSEFWQGHRFGGRADVGLVQAQLPTALEVVCAGHASPEVLHRRRFELDEAMLRVADELDAPARAARIHLPLAPGLEPQLDGAIARVALEAGRALEIGLPAEASFRVERRPYYPEFGNEQLRAVLVGEASPLAKATMELRLVEPG